MYQSAYNLGYKYEGNGVIIQGEYIDLLAKVTSLNHTALYVILKDYR